MIEVVYVLSNPAMPDHIKIGRTTRSNLEKRIKDLSRPTGVPEAFVLLMAVEVADAGKVEKAFLKAFAGDRKNPKREFLKMTPEPILTLLEAFATSEDLSESVRAKVLGETASPEEKLAQEAFVAEIRVRRSNLRFDEIGVPKGVELVYQPDPSKKCKVVGDKNEVEYEGEILILSALATKFMLGYTKPVQVQGASFFTYEDELLTDRRDRLEREEEA